LGGGGRGEDGIFEDTFLAFPWTDLGKPG